MRRFHRLAPLWVALLSVSTSAVVAFFAPLPNPQFHDEFSYLLAGDTFARGRLTNPPHPLWEFFETFHVLQQPTYSSKYPPGQGLMLALGQALFGEPVAGAWVGGALACAAVWWALAGFAPRRWATLGAIIVATHPVMLKANFSYWGGAVAAIGGALVVGGIARVFRRGDTGAGIGLGVGMFVLAVSRPFEGAVLTILCIFLLRPPSPQPSPEGRGGRTWHAIGAAALCVAIGAAWIGYYNWRVTGRAWRLPYVEYESQYGMTPSFVWMPRTRPPPAYRHETM